MKTVLKVGKEITTKELKTFIKNHTILGITFNIIDNFYHINISNTHISLYNNENEHVTSDNNYLNIPIMNIDKMIVDHVDNCYSTIIITIYPFGKMILFLPTCNHVVQ